MEEWRSVPDEKLKHKYFISNLGRIRSLQYGDNFLSAYYNKKRRYYYISCQVPGYRKNFILHRLVAKVFVPNPNKYKCVDHINFDTKDNRADNLEWVTPKENTRRAMVANRIPFQEGEKSWRTRLKNQDVIKMFELHREGLSNTDIGKMFGLKQPAVSLILNGKRWCYIYKKQIRDEGLKLCDAFQYK